MAPSPMYWWIFLVINAVCISSLTQLTFPSAAHRSKNDATDFVISLKPGERAESQLVEVTQLPFSLITPFRWKLTVDEFQLLHVVHRARQRHQRVLPEWLIQASLLVGQNSVGQIHEKVHSRRHVGFLRSPETTSEGAFVLVTTLLCS